MGIVTAIATIVTAGSSGDVSRAKQIEAAQVEEVRKCLAEGLDLELDADVIRKRTQSVAEKILS